MGFLSDTFGGIKDAVSSGWDSFKDGVEDVTGLDSITDWFNPIAWGSAIARGEGLVGEYLQDYTQPLTGVQGQGQMQPRQAITGPLAGTAPASMTMGSGGTPDPQIAGEGDPQGTALAGLFGDSGYTYGPTSTALLQANPEAYQFNPLFGQV